ncbi:unnamed protein product, partial [Symbiodinium sp. KB8]
MKHDMSARGATAQAMGRALKHKPDVKTLYGLLLDSFKVEFRRAWSCSRSFQFVTTTRTTVNTFRKRRDELGTFKTFLQIVQILGGSDEPIALEQAKNYTKMCCRDDLKEHCVLYNDWLKADTYLWVEQLLTTSNIQEWKSTVSVEVKETVPGSWSEKVELSKAVRCYAAENNLRLVDVRESDVKESELGVQGYAALFEKTPAAQPKPGGDGSNAGGNKGGKGKRALDEESKIDGAPPTPGAVDPPQPNKRPKGGDSSVATKKEKEVKELLAQEQASDNTMSMITIEMGKGEADGWAWAAGFVKNYKDCRVQ